MLHRLRHEPGFGAELARDPQAALAGYELTAEDLRHLADRCTPRTEEVQNHRPSALRTLLTGEGEDGPRP